jgi:transposase, IS5 family
VCVRELPADLAALDRVLADPRLLAPIVERWRREVVVRGRGVLTAGRPTVVVRGRGVLTAGRPTVVVRGRGVLTAGRPTVAMKTYIWLMVMKQRYRWGYRTLVSEVSDSIHLRRFCRIALSERLPGESTMRKLTRRIDAETVNELTRVLIASATREQRFRARAIRIDSTVIEADVRYPTDSGLAGQGSARSPVRAQRSLALSASPSGGCGIARGRWGARCVR